MRSAQAYEVLTEVTFILATARLSTAAHAQHMSAASVDSAAGVGHVPGAPQPQPLIPLARITGETSRLDATSIHG